MCTLAGMQSLGKHTMASQKCVPVPPLLLPLQGLQRGFVCQQELGASFVHLLLVRCTLQLLCLWAGLL